MKLYIRGKEHGKDLIDSVLNGPFEYGTVVEDGIPRTKIYEKLTDKEKIRDIVLQGLLPDVYNIVNHHIVAKEIWDRLAIDMHESNFDQLYAYLKQHEVHANEVLMMRERFPDPLALVANYHHTPSNYNSHHSQYNPSQYQQQLSPIAQQLYNSHQQPLSYEALAHQQSYHSLAIH
ncbi:hypothetical protein Tco_1321684 [Tanacetum coccineum]